MLPTAARGDPRGTQKGQQAQPCLSVPVWVWEHRYGYFCPMQGSLSSGPFMGVQPVTPDLGQSSLNSPCTAVEMQRHRVIERILEGRLALLECSH